jgi:DNA-binding transcriptional regulator GbsR (MarR family)
MANNWTLMASHGCVLFYLATHKDATIREVAGATDLTERRVSQIVRDLSDAEMLQVQRQGRRNTYEVNTEARFPEPLAEVPLGSFIEILQESGVGAAR